METSDPEIQFGPIPEGSEHCRILCYSIIQEGYELRYVGFTIYCSILVGRYMSHNHVLTQVSSMYSGVSKVMH